MVEGPMCILISSFIFIQSYHRADTKTFYRWKIGPLLAKIQSLLYREVKFYVFLKNKNTQATSFLSLFFFQATKSPGNYVNRKNIGPEYSKLTVGVLVNTRSCWGAGRAAYSGNAINFGLPENQTTITVNTPIRPIGVLTVEWGVPHRFILTWHMLSFDAAALWHDARGKN